MRGGVFPPAMLCLALGLALAFLPRRVALTAGLICVVVALMAWSLLPKALPIEFVFVGCWTSVIVTAASTYLPKTRPAFAGYALAANTGLWVGAVVAVAATPRDLFAALPFVLVCAVGWPIVARGWGVAIKVGASWLIAIATLSAMLPLTPTPGYVPDHME